MYRFNHRNDIVGRRELRDAVAKVEDMSLA